MPARGGLAVVAVVALLGSASALLGSPVLRPRPSVTARWMGKKNAPMEAASMDEVLAQVATTKADAAAELEAAAANDEVEKVRVKYLGKKGSIQAFMSLMRSLPKADKPKLGEVVNVAKTEIEEAITVKCEELDARKFDDMVAAVDIDVTLPGRPRREVGYAHPLTLVMDKATNIFRGLGYDVVTGALDSPEMETDYYCFTALNSPPDHPARSMQDTFYLDLPVDQEVVARVQADGNVPEGYDASREGRRLLRTHTSSVQIHEMERREPPFRIVAPGRVYRKDEIDATHSPIFHQVEILALEEKGKLTLNDLKGTVEHFLKAMFGPDIECLFRGSYFPFTEPSMEVDVLYKGKWLEVLGCGMVDPRVLEKTGIDPNKYSGFAAGFGVERFAMVTYGIPDIRLFWENDMRFLSQFPANLKFNLADDVPYRIPEPERLARLEHFPLDINSRREIEPDEPNAPVPEDVKLLSELEDVQEEEAAAAAADDPDFFEDKKAHQATYPPEFMEESWEDCFRLLVDFHKEHGHTRVSRLHRTNDAVFVDEDGRKHFRDDKRLARWVMVQRDVAESGELKPAYRARLAELGFNFNFCEIGEDDSDAVLADAMAEERRQFKEYLKRKFARLERGEDPYMGWHSLVTEADKELPPESLRTAEELGEFQSQLSWEHP